MTLTMMQVSSGVSVAYFSSIALLGLAAAQPASAMGTGDTTTYFDSVVFLTGFLLAGVSRLLDSVQFIYAMVLFRSLLGSIQQGAHH